MKTVGEVTAAKLRGGFYSPDALVRLCLDRAGALVGATDGLRVLEPTAGDGAFLRGLAGHPLRQRVSWATAVEIVGAEAAVARRCLESAAIDGEVVHGSFLRWVAHADNAYDVAVGNPPFVRFQFVAPEQRAEAEALARRLGLAFRGVSNLWQPVLLGALWSLRPGGVFAFIVPAEIFTGISGNDVREWLLANVADLHLDIFEARSFPDVLQEVVVISGRRRDVAETPSRTMRFHTHSAMSSRTWRHSAQGSARTWTRYLLTPGQLTILDAAVALPSVTSVGHLARFDVSTVTGANAYFCVDDATVEQFGLAPWTRPLLPRTRHAPGLVYTDTDHKAVAAAGLRAHLLDFAPERPDPAETAAAGSYLAVGVELGLPGRYKCRVRQPWYRVPVVDAGALLLAKRSHHHPRVLVNEAAVVTTDTIYRGRMMPDAAVTARALAASFHNSLTMLSAEIEGRSFGGGVLELVPTEVARLSVPVAPEMAGHLEQLDDICRNGMSDLVEATDVAVSASIPGLGRDMLAGLRDAAATLRALRLARN